jgi:6-methylpretetramide 4-monooxygenase / 4-hydroxy-6-methylpretetramide 12a-monooxygenase
MTPGGEVLIVGAGPSGLLAAVELARHGVPARLVEREPVPHDQARATAIQPATLEILAQAGVADRFVAAAEHLTCSRLYDAGLGLLSEMPFGGIGCRWEFQASLPQASTEAILAGRLAELGGSVERGVTVTALEPRGDGLRVELEHAGGTAEQVQPSWVLGAGGAHSVTRDSLAQELAGETYPGTALVADLRVSCGLPRDGGALIAAPEGYVLLAPLPGGRWLTFVGDLQPAEAAALESSGPAQAVVTGLERRVRAPISVAEVRWAAPFRMHRRLVARLAGDRRFLLGDAGHLSSPFGGEGLNSGLHDAQNLAWKLALVVQGRARPGLLDSYAAERHAADEHVLAVSDQLHQLTQAAVDAARTGVPAVALDPAGLAALIRSRAMLDVSYPDSPLTGEYRVPGAAPLPGPAPGDRYPDRADLTGTGHHLLVFGPVRPGVEALSRRWRGLVEVSSCGGDPLWAGLPASGGAILVRPDGFIGYRCVPAETPGLAALDAHLASYLIPAA